MTAIKERMSIPASFNKLLLIKLVHARPALWDKTDDSYRRKFMKDEAWNEICRIMKKNYDNLSGTERQNYYRWLSKVWRHTRDSWARSLNARKKAKKFGTSVRPYIYDREMAFLKKIKGTSKSSIGDGGNTEDEEDEEDEALEEENNEESESDSGPTWDHDYGYIGDNTDDEWNVDSKEGIVTANNPDDAINEIDSTVKRKDNPTTEDLIDAKITTYLNQMQKIKTAASDIQEDRHYAFFKGLHPSLTLLDDDQVLEFQSGVINLLRNIKRGGRLSNVTNDQACSSLSRGFYLTNQPEAPIVPQQTVVAPHVTQNISSGSAGSSRPQLRLELDPLQSD